MIEPAAEKKPGSLTGWIACALALLIIASTMNGYRYELGLLGRSITIRPDQVALVPLLILLVVGMARGAVRWTWVSMDLPVLGMVLVNLLASLFFSPFRSESLQGVVLMAVYALMYFAARLAAPRALTRVQRLIQLFVLLGVAQALYGIAAVVARMAGADIGGVHLNQVSVTSVTARGTFFEANLLGILMTVIGVCLVVAALYAQSARARVFASLGLVPVVVAMVLTVTRSAWLTFTLFFLGLITIGALEQKRLSVHLKRAVWPVLSMLVVLVVAIWVIDPALSRLWNDKHVLTARLSGVVDGIRTSLEHNVGPGSTPAVARRTFTSVPSKTATVTPTIARTPTRAASANRGAQAGNGLVVSASPAASPVSSSTVLPGATAEPSKTLVPRTQAASPMPTVMAQASPSPTATKQEYVVRTASEGSSNSIKGRLSLYWEAWVDAGERPVLGHGTFGGVVVRRRYWISSMAQALYDAGFVGLGVLLWMYATVVVSSWKAYRRSPPGWMRTSLLAACLSNIVLIVTSQFTSFLWAGFPWVFMGLTMGLVSAARGARPSP